MAQPVWITPAGVVGQKVYSLGAASSLNAFSLQLQANPVVPAVSVTYRVISGTIPAGLSLNQDGLLFGIPSIVNELQNYTFAVRATDNLGNIRDRTFSLTITGSAIPTFTTPAGEIIDTPDSIWTSYQIGINNPNLNNTYIVRILQGILPPGLEINDQGLIRGYADAPIINVDYTAITTATTSTTADNIITCLSTTGFSVGRPILFTGTVFGAIIANETYYVKTILNSTQFTISTTPEGAVLSLTDDSGFMTTTLPATTIGQPTSQTYNFALQLLSDFGNDIANYSITVRNQNLSVSKGGLGKPPNSRIPAILNTRPETFDLNNSNPYFGYYILPSMDSIYNTYPPTVFAPIGKFFYDNFFSFKVIGYDFDGDDISYTFVNLPLGLVGDTNTGWITGTPIIAGPDINEYNFGVSVYKTEFPAFQSQTFYFSFIITNSIVGNISWLTPSDLGSINNGSVCIKSVSAIADIALEYRLSALSTLPPNLTLLPNGEITGTVSDQPTSSLLTQNSSTTFSFTIEAYSPLYSIVRSEKTFQLTVVQKFETPMDTLYIKATPSIEDRVILETLLEGQLSDQMIPPEVLFRSDDSNFGKATSVIYEHAYGIFASDIDEYIAAVTKNHYWRNITLGELKTAVAKDQNGVIIYEVVYSQVIDNLVNPQGISISQEITWPRLIDLNLGPWYTSITDIYTSYVNILGQDFYTSLTPGYAKTLYPNSLSNMRNRVASVLGQEPSSDILPLWMTSQQENGSTLGFTQAWVICYTRPGFAETVKNNINTLWPYTLNQINFKIDRFTVDKSLTYNYDKNVTPPAWTGLPSATPVPDPIDSQDFYVLFPRKTILPNQV